MDEEGGGEEGSLDQKRGGAGFGVRHIVRTMRGDTRSLLVLQREGKEEDKRRVRNIAFRIYGEKEKVFFSNIINIFLGMFGKCMVVS